MSPIATATLTVDDKLAEIQARGTLVIATDPDYAPQSLLLRDAKPSAQTKCGSTQYTASQFEGFDVDVATEIAKKLNVEPCFVTPPWSQLVAGNWGDNWDIHVGSVAITFERMNDLYFSQPYYATPTVLLVNKENTSYQEIEDLSDKRIGICVGCTFESYLNHDLKLPGQELNYRIENAHIVAYENEEPAIADLSLGDGIELDAVMTILPKARAAIDAGRPVRMLEEAVMFAYASVTLDRSSHRDSARLLVEINQIIDDLHSSGRLKELSLQYQGIDLTQEAAQFEFHP
jgi:polar amino acid transport system substrate-binding protein